MKLRLYFLLFASVFCGANLAHVPLQFGAKDQDFSSIGAFPNGFILCNKSNLMVLNSVSLTPDPIQPGKQLKIKIAGVMNEEVTSGKALVSASINDVMIIKDYEQDICELLHSINMTCPLKKGDLNLDFTSNIPGPAPSAKYSAQATLKDQNGNELICLNFTQHL